MVDLSVKCESKTTEEDWKRLEKAVSDFADAFHELMPVFEKAARSLQKLADYAPIPVEGTVRYGDMPRARNS